MLNQQGIKTIIMPGKTTIKFINSLKQKKFRKQHGLFIAEGEKMVDELMESNFTIHSIYATRQWIMERCPAQEEVAGKGTGNATMDNKTITRQPPSDSGNKMYTCTGTNDLKQDNTKGLSKGHAKDNSPLQQQVFKLYEIGEQELKRISSLATPNRVLALVHTPSHTPDPAVLRNSLTLVLDDIQDPGNLGTLIRTCHWFGVENMILSKNSADITNPKVVQSTMGSIFHVRAHYLDLPAFLKLPGVEGIPVYGTFPGGPSIYDRPLTGEAMILLGSESKGISPRAGRFITNKISIPSLPGKKKPPESLNIAVAGGIIISEFRRRKGGQP